jgi:hypothetical protein
MRELKRAAVVLLAMTACLAAGDTVKVFVGDKALPGPFSTENGRVVGPVADVAKALGAEVEWHNDAYELMVTPRPAWRAEPIESLAGHTCSPYDLMALGPTTAVRQKLAAQQAESLRLLDGKAALLARYEIIEAINWYSGPTSGGPDEAGFSVTALLYWLYPDPASTVPLDGRVGILRADGGSAEGPAPRKLVIQQVDYHLKPGLRSPRPLPGGGVAWTVSRWEIDREPDVKEIKTVDLKGKKEQDAMPVYDVSALDVGAQGSKP